VPLTSRPPPDPALPSDPALGGGSTIADAPEPGGTPPDWGQSGVGWSGAELGPASGPAPEGNPASRSSESQRYTPGNLVGRGGMGRVRVAHDRRLSREVALKELDPRLAHVGSAVIRMEREALLTAALDHPGIVAVHDAGRLPDGRPFYTMRLVRGRSLQAAIREAPSLQARLGLTRHLLAAAEAVAAAHEAGVVHRDLKPANILLGGFGETQVIDWGLAVPRAGAEGRFPALAELPPVREGVVGTPDYMSPEQALGAAPEPTADVWSLGKVLQALLVGGRPLPGAPQGAPPELLAVVERAGAADPADRYPDAGALALELLRWFEGRRVLAYRYTPLELLGRLLQAWRVPLLVASVGLALVIVALGVGWQQSRRERDRAQAAEVATGLQLARTQVEQAVVALAEDARPRAERLAASALRRGDDPLARGVLAAFGVTARPERLERSAGWDCRWSSWSADGALLLCGLESSVELWEVAERQRRWSAPVGAWQGWLREEVDEVHLIGATPDLLRLRRSDGAALPSLPRPADRLAWLPRSGRRHVWRAGAIWPGPQPLADHPCEAGLELAVPASTGDRLALVCGEGTVWLGTFDEPLGRAVPTPLTGDLQASAAAWSPDGASVLLGGLRGLLVRVDVAQARVAATYRSALGAIEALEVSADGRLAAVTGERGGVGLWNLETGVWLGELPAERPFSLRFLPDGRTLLVHDGRLWRWRVPGEGSPYRLGFSSGVADLALSPDDARLAVATGDGGVHVLDRRSGRAEAPRRLGEAVVKAVAWSPDREALFATGMGGAELARFTTVGERALSGARPLRRLVVSPGGALLGLDLTRGLARWSGAGEGPVWSEPARSFSDLEPDGAGAVALDGDGGLFHVEQAGQIEAVGLHPGALAAAASPALWGLAYADRVELWRRAGPGPGQRLHSLPAPQADLRDLAFSPDGRLVAAGGLDGRARVWSVSDGALRLVLPGHVERIAALTFSADSERLVTGSWDHSVRLWDLSRLDWTAEALADEVLAVWGTE
jgi:WD40 repeat protein/tRNA A-37 threonylcarbamoyl transferase component Bud32